MGNDLKLDIGTLYAFLLVLARVSGMFIYLPLPGIKSVNEVARVVLALSTTLVLYPSWPAMSPAGVNIVILTGWILAEAGLGLAVGLVVAFLAEGFQMGAQMISLQAGYSFATTIDPTSGADSGVLITIAQTTAGLLFFATGLDRQIIFIFAQSLTAHPPGHYILTPSMVNVIVQLGSTVFTTGLRLVLPLLGLLLMVEISIGLLARLNSQLHLTQLAFPMKMLMSLALLGWLLSIFPKVFLQTAGPLLQVIRRLLTA